MTGFRPDATSGSSKTRIERATEVVTRLQERIVQAMKGGEKRKVRGLQRLLVRSYSGRVLAVERVSRNQGSRSARVDGVTW